MQEKFVTSGRDIRIASIKMNYIDKVQRDTQWVQILSAVALRFFNSFAFSCDSLWTIIWKKFLRPYSERAQKDIH